MALMTTILWATAVALLLGLFALYRIILRTQEWENGPRPTGLRVISDPPGAKFEIVAVHGLSAHPEQTWVCSPMQDAPKKVHLLKHLLKDAFPEARILSFGYHSNWQVNATIKTARQISHQLLKDIAEDHQHHGRLPIIFLGHSFGGIVIKEAICAARANDNETLEDISGVIFLGTPHQGSNSTVPVLVASLLSRVVGSDATLLLSLKLHASSLSDLEERFREVLRARKQRGLQVLSFCETRPTFLVPGWFSLGLIVDRNSAIGSASECIPIDANHSGLNKCSGADDPTFRAIEEAIKLLREPSRLEQADEIIRRHYTGERLEIRRLSGEHLPLENCYVNLSIASHNDEKDTNRHSESGCVNLSRLFEPRHTPREGMKEVRRILIRGSAGVGKTTLCKKLVHDFVYQRRWCDKFDRILWLPLRRLKNRNSQTSLEDVLLNEFFLHQGHAQGRVFAGDLCHNLVETKYDRTLFLLDGLDELSGDWGHDDDLDRLLRYLLGLPTLIVTTRPHAEIPIALRTFDLQLTALGFFWKQVREYVSKVIPDQVSEISTFLSEQESLRSLVSIPIQLDALCYTWDSDFRDEPPQTMTQVYKAIELKLWKKDIVRKNPRLETCLKITRIEPQIRTWIPKEWHLLELFAFSGLNSGILDFDDRRRDQIYKLFLQSPEGTSASNVAYDDILSSLSFVRTSDPLSPTMQHQPRTYHFIHLTFQEYFAARYFVRKWAANEPLQGLGLSPNVGVDKDAAAFLRENKYTKRFDVFWRFASGLLDSNKIDAFFDLMDEPPRDILGPTHEELILSRRAEAQDRRTQCNREAFQHRLTEWILFNLKTQRTPSRLGLSGDCEKPLVDALQQLSTEQHVEADKYFWGSVPTSTLRSIAVNDKQLDPELRLEMLLSTLGQRLGHGGDEHVVPDILNLLATPNSLFIQHTLRRLYLCQSQLPDAVYKAILNLAGDSLDGAIILMHIENRHVLYKMSISPDELLVVRYLSDLRAAYATVGAKIKEEEVARARSEERRYICFLQRRKTPLKKLEMYLMSRKPYKRKLAMNILYRCCYEKRLRYSKKLRAALASHRECLLDSLSHEETAWRDKFEALLVTYIQDYKVSLNIVRIQPIHESRNVQPSFPLDALSEGIVRLLWEHVENDSLHSRKATQILQKQRTEFSVRHIHARLRMIIFGSDDVASRDAITTTIRNGLSVIFVIYERKRSCVPKDMFEDIMSWLSCPRNDVVLTIINALGGLPEELPPLAINTLVELICSSSTTDLIRSGARDLLVKNLESYAKLADDKHVVCLYRTLLYMSRSSNVVWYVKDGFSYIQTPKHSVKIPIQNEARLEEFLSKARAEGHPYSLTGPEGAWPGSNLSRQAIESLEKRP